MALVLGQRIKEEREKNQLTQDDLANILNVSRQTISKWELGSAYPDTERLIEISDYFHISLDSLIKGDPELKERIVVNNQNNHSSFWDFMMRTGWMVAIAIVWIIGRMIIAVWG
ncbi:hypothetical protein LPAF129_11670 [Ligilactobacillus pabuli]|uniref:HTH cro/C1-type domain-containing protein n=1 Tax=Ligilactobacillus pabuli TaxID=2886039 RepID=A0ABQ5JI00_9LACO|nr:helix-turn-helix transcriptional regulator [Ligilactobacillus pabuli]GKS81481.1 hypothetical protein LPAF129_11670 [Ligilactobacillus pabuli]HIW89528.1 helix-turn-helix domain-containing protein [Candidatus Ligilactobacillus excrementipullorum]